MSAGFSIRVSSVSVVTSSPARARDSSAARRAVAGEQVANPSASARRKLGFREQHELKILPARMTELEASIGKLRAILSDGALYARDPARFQKASAALVEAEGALSAAEDRWLALEMQRESDGA